MASGTVAKKIALFEIKPQSLLLEQACRLKRKHAIRRKKYRGKERRIVTREGTSMIALSTSDEHLNHLKDYEDDTSSSSSTSHPHYSPFSASCSALFDLLSVESSDLGSGRVTSTVEDKAHMEILPSKQRLVYKSGSSKEKCSKRLNIIDIDIEIKIEKKEHQRDHSPVLTTCCGDEYEPLLLEVENSSVVKQSSKSTAAPVGVTTTDRIHLTALVDDGDDSAERSVTYYCSNRSHDHNPAKKAIKDKGKNSNLDDNVNSSDEPLYENIFTSVPPPPVSLGAPPLPPKRLFGDSFTTNYSCLPARRNGATYGSSTSPENRRLSVNDQIETIILKAIDSSIKKSSQLHERNNNENERTSSDDTDFKKETSPITTGLNKPDTKIRDHVTGSGASNPLPLSSNPGKDVTTTEALAICPGKELPGNDAVVVGEVEDDEEEPFYEDLYDYCNGPERSNTDLLDPLIELFRDQFNSLEQNVQDEVEYCDCTTMNLMSRPGIENVQNDNEISENKILPGDAAVGVTATAHPDEFSLEPDTSSLKSYEIYDDCFGVDATTALGRNEDGGMSSFDISNDDGIACMPKFGLRRNSIGNTNTTSSCSSTSHILSDYIKYKVTKASTPGCWPKITSSNAQPEENPNTKKVISTSRSSSPASASSPLSVFPSLSSSKTKLVEPNLATNANTEEQQRPGESLPNEASSSSPRVIAENERNVSKTKNANNGCIYAYGMLKCGNNNGNSKPRFGGRPVIAHPMDGADAEDQTDKEENNGGDNEPDQSGDGLTHKTHKKDDNEIFNKPLPLPPANSSPYESVYNEPIYGITNQLTATYSDSGKPSSGGSPGKRRSSAPAAPFISNKPLTVSKPGGSLYSHSPSISSGSTYGYSSGSVNDYGDIGSTPKYGQSVASPSSMNASVSTTASDGMSIYGVNDKLPPTPPSKFSSIAKTAGRKIAKRFLGIRKTSKCGMDESLSVFSTNGVDSVDITGSSNSNLPQHNDSADLQGSKGSNPPVTNYNSNEKTVFNNGGNGGPGGGGAQIRRPISRPSLPPPEPPKNEVGTTVPALPDKGNDYNIYDKKNDDDYEDSDFYDSDSELIRNFVSQVQPIYSMEEEPLYQYYTYGISLKPDDDYQPVIPKNLGLTLDMLVPRVGQRTLWCELPGVVSSGILSILSDKQKQLQEAIFEILTSEVSYLKSLDVLITLFYKNEELIGVLTEDERNYLFGNIEGVRDCSQAFLSELLGKWEESWYIQEIGEIISRNTETRFSVYKEYCRNKPYQDKAMQRLRHTRDEFVSVVKGLEEDQKCQMLQIDSFLMLPMQRITRLPLLVNAVLQRTAAGKEKNKCEEALKCLTNLVLSCNDAARESQDAEETMAILEKLEFTRGIKALPDLGQFIMKGDFMKNPFDNRRGSQLNWTFRKAKRTFYWLLLFSKQLLVARRKANGRFEIIDMVDPSESNIKTLPNLDGVAKDFKHFFMLHFSRKETVYFLAARTNSEVERWKSKLDSLSPKEELRVEAIFPYDARREDELSFYVGDVIRVSQMQPDGWYFGMKLATGESGWFPGNYCCEKVT